MAPPVLGPASAIALANVVRPSAEKLESEVRSFVGGNFKAVKSITDDLQSLSNEIPVVYSMLEKLEKVKNPGDEMIVWRGKAIELCYKIEHRKYEYLCDNGKLSTKLWLSHIIKDLKKDLNDIHRSYKWDQVETTDLFRELNCLPLSDLAHGHTTLQGCERKYDELIGLLSWDQQREGNNNVRIICIKGPGGSGKTALALSAMSSTTNYDISAAVGVSGSCSTMNLLRDIWKGVTQKELSPNMPHEDDLISNICEFLSNKRYIILLDDVWNEDTWEFLKPAFPSNGLGSRILLTTRVKSFALCCPERNEMVIEMLPLEYAVSKALFLTAIFGQNRCPEEFKGHLDAILKKCDGLPLPILKIASHILRSGPTQMEAWAEMSGEVNCFSNFLGSSPLYELHHILSLGYTLLPRNHKNCALFLCGLPQDSTIDADIAICSWISESFVDSRSAGETCLCQLISYHLVQAVQMSVDGKVLSIRVPKLIHDVLGKISHEKLFYAIMTKSEVKRTRVNRLSLLSADEEFSASCNKMKKTRALILHSSKDVPFEKCTYLRILVVYMCKGFSDSDLKTVAQLAFLKVLVLDTPNISELPRQTRNLRRLEALVMQRSRSRKLLTLSTFHFLTCLKVGVVALPAGICLLKKLEKLEVFDVGRSQIEAVSELGQLHSLKVLSCFYNSPIGAVDYTRHLLFVAAIRELLTIGNLEELIFTGESSQLQFISFFQVDVLPSKPLHKFCLESNLFLSSFPVILQRFSQLSDISINLETMRPMDVEIFGNFRCLKQLKLWIHSAVTIEFNVGMFQQLQRLALCSPKLDLRFKAGCLKKLHGLHLLTKYGLSLSGLHEASNLERLYVSLIEATGDVTSDVLSITGEAVSKCRGHVKSYVGKESWRTPKHPCFVVLEQPLAEDV